MSTKNLFHRMMPYTFEDYGTLCAMTNIDIMTHGYRKTFGLIIQVTPNEKGVDNKGSRASGSANAIVIDGTRKQEYPLINIGDTIVTPFGSYVVTWYREFEWSRINPDHLTLIEVK